VVLILLRNHNLAMNIFRPRSTPPSAAAGNNPGPARASFVLVVLLAGQSLFAGNLAAAANAAGPRDNAGGGREHPTNDPAVAGSMSQANSQSQAHSKLALELELDQLRETSLTPALGLVLFDGHSVSVFTAGPGISADTPFRWGSITKTFTALALLRLVEQGKVSLEVPLRELLPPGRFNNPWQRSHPVRLAHLLELSAGFSDLSTLEFNYNEPLSLEAAFALNPGSRTALWPPGLQHSYSNSTPGLTAAVVESVSGQSFEAFIKTEVFGPLGMDNASLEPVPGLPGGFKADGKTPIPYWHMTFRAFGALNASAKEMSRFLGVLLNRGLAHADTDTEPDKTAPIFAPESLNRLFRAHTGIAGENQLPVSYGAGSYGWVSGGHVFYGHGGDADGYRSRYGLLPDALRGYAIVINVDNSQLLRRMQRKIEAFLTHDLARPIAPESTDSQDLSQYTGPYYPASARFGLERWRSGRAPRASVAIEGQELRFSYRGKHTQLIQVSAEGLFRRPQDPLATVIFARDPAGSLYLQGQLGNFFSLKSAPCPGFIRVCEKQ
jgi:CubicO group peptidase (beta-lactamase class C family)